MLKRLLIFFFMFTCSCKAPDFFQEGEKKCHQIADLLKKVQSRDDLVNMRDLLERKFQEIVDIMILAHKYTEDHPEICSFRRNAYSDELMQEFKRIYALEGCRECMENMQREPMIRLDAYLNKQKKEKNIKQNF